MLRALLLTALVYTVGFIAITVFVNYYQNNADAGSDLEQIKDDITFLVERGSMCLAPAAYLLEACANYFLIKLAERKMMLCVELLRIVISIGAALLLIKDSDQREQSDYAKFIYLVLITFGSYGVAGLSAIMYKHRARFSNQLAIDWRVAFNEAWQDFIQGVSTLFSVAADTWLFKMSVYLYIFSYYQPSESIAALGVLDVVQVLILLGVVLPMQLSTQHQIRAVIENEEFTLQEKKQRYSAIMHTALAVHTVLVLVIATLAAVFSGSIASVFEEAAQSDNRYLKKPVLWFLSTLITLPWGWNNIYEGVSKGLERKKGWYSAVNVGANGLLALITWRIFKEYPQATVEHYLGVAGVTFTLSAVLAYWLNRITDVDRALQNRPEQDGDDCRIGCSRGLSYFSNYFWWQHTGAVPMQQVESQFMPKPAAV